MKIVITFFVFFYLHSAINELSSQAVSDIDGNIYGTVSIGDQIWLAQNLKVLHFQNGDPIPVIDNQDDWLHTMRSDQSACCLYEKHEESYPVYGLLYNYYAVVDSRQICPQGWHTPTKKEWSILIKNIGGTRKAGGKMKEIGTDLWAKPNLNATNESGFSALPGGFRYGGGFSSMHAGAYFWTSSSYNKSEAWGQALYFNESKVFKHVEFKNTGHSVRCIKNK